MLEKIKIHSTQSPPISVKPFRASAIVLLWAIAGVAAAVGSIVFFRSPLRGGRRHQDRRLLLLITGRRDCQLQGLRGGRQGRRIPAESDERAARARRPLVFHPRVLRLLERDAKRLLGPFPIRPHLLAQRRVVLFPLVRAQGSGARRLHHRIGKVQLSVTDFIIGGQRHVREAVRGGGAQILQRQLHRLLLLLEAGRQRFRE